MRRVTAVAAITTVALTAGACSNKKDPADAKSSKTAAGASATSTTAAPITTPTSPSASTSLSVPESPSPTAETSSSSPTPSSSPTATTAPSTKPSRTAGPRTSVPATGAVKRELEAAARAFYEGLNKAYVTGDETPLRPLVSPSCICVESVDSVRQNREDGRTVHLIYDILSVAAHDATATSGEVTLVYNIARNEVEEDGKIIATFPPVKNGLKELTFRQVDGRWLLQHVVTYKT